ncbi:hypothetical protein ACG1BZ_14755 [Microbulbifer sp. CNSA002]
MLFDTNIIAGPEAVIDPCPTGEEYIGGGMCAPIKDKPKGDE